MRTPMFCLAVIVALSGVAGADEVLLNDGSRLVGKVTRLEGGKLKVTTDFAGELVIDAAKVKGITTAQALVVRVGGDQATGKLSYTEAGGQKVAGEALGERAVEVKNLAAAWQPGDDSPEALAARAAAPKWSFRAEAGVNGQTGNSEIVNFLGSAQARMTAEKERLTLYGLGRYSRVNGERTAMEFIGGATLEHDFTERVFGWGKAELETDEFEDLDLRASVTAGVGCFVVREPDREFKVRAGVGFMHESFGSGEDNNTAIAELGYDLRHDLTEWLRLTHSLTYYPTLESVSDFRVLAETAGEMPITKDGSWFIRIGMRNQYVNEPAPGIDELDTYYFANIVFETK